MLRAKSREFLWNFGYFRIHFREFLVNICGNPTTSWGVNLVVAGAQVGLPTKQPDVLKLQAKEGKLKSSHHFVR